MTMVARVFRHLHQEFAMAQVSNVATVGTIARATTGTTAQISKTVVPVGGGGLPGHLLRMAVMVFTGGFVFPNTFVEGMDLTAIQKEHQLPEKNGK
jgi:hypothetical protein